MGSNNYYAIGLLLTLILDSVACVEYSIEPQSEILPINSNNTPGFKRIYGYANDDTIPVWSINGTFYPQNIGLPSYVHKSSYEYRGDRLYVFLEFSNSQNVLRKVNVKCGGPSATEWSNTITLVWLNDVPHFVCNLTAANKTISWGQCVNENDYVTYYKVVIKDTITGTLIGSYNVTNTQFVLPIQENCSYYQVSVYPVNVVGEGVGATITLSMSEVMATTETAIVPTSALTLTGTNEPVHPSGARASVIIGIATCATVIAVAVITSVMIMILRHRHRCVLIMEQDKPQKCETLGAITDACYADPNALPIQPAPQSVETTSHSSSNEEIEAVMFRQTNSE